MSANETTKLDLIKQRLDLLIYLQLRKSDIIEMTISEQIVLLRRLGLTNPEIAHLFGVTVGYISSEVARQKKRQKE